MIPGIWVKGVAGLHYLMASIHFDGRLAFDDPKSEEVVVPAHVHVLPQEGIDRTALLVKRSGLEPNF